MGRDVAGSVCDRCDRGGWLCAARDWHWDTPRRGAPRNVLLAVGEVTLDLAIVHALELARHLRNAGKGSGARPQHTRWPVCVQTERQRTVSDRGPSDIAPLRFSSPTALDMVQVAFEMANGLLTGEVSLGGTRDVDATRKRAGSEPAPLPLVQTTASAKRLPSAQGGCDGWRGNGRASAGPQGGRTGE